MVQIGMSQDTAVLVMITIGLSAGGKLLLRFGICESAYDVATDSS